MVQARAGYQTMPTSSASAVAMGIGPPSASRTEEFWSDRAGDQTGHAVVSQRRRHVLRGSVGPS